MEDGGDDEEMEGLLLRQEVRNGNLNLCGKWVSALKTKGVGRNFRRENADGAAIFGDGS